MSRESEYFTRVFEAVVYSLGDISKKTGLIPKRLKMTIEIDEKNKEGKMIWHVDEYEFEHQKTVEV